MNQSKEKPQFLLLKKATLSASLALICFNAGAYLPVFPLDPNNPNATHTGAGRFGEGRAKGNANPAGFGTYGHQGIDISGGSGKALYAVADSIVVGSIDTGAGGGIGTALKPLNGSDIVVVYWHQKSITPLATLNKTVKAGDHIGAVGNTSKPTLSPQSSSMAPHLHLGIGVANPAHAVSLTLNNTANGKNQFYKVGLGGSSGGASHTRSFKGKSYLWTNPAPYLSRDVIIRPTTGVDPLRKYIGNSIRTQYNALTGASLPLKPPAKQGELAHLIPKLKIADNGVPSSVSTELKQAAVVGALVGGEADELLGQESITPEVLAYYAQPRTIFTGADAEVKIDIGDGDITHAELINKVGTSRFGNPEWQKELVGTSMRGMLIEYLNMINAKNFIKKETIKQKERIESLYAAWTATLTKSNHSTSINESFKGSISAVEIPELSTLPVEELYRMVDEGMDISAYDLSRAVSLTGGQYQSCDTSYINAFRAVPAAKRKELLSLALRLGFNPNDFATAVAVETSFERDPNKLYPVPVAVKNKNGKTVMSHGAAGYIQLTRGGAAGIPYNRLVEIYPAAKPVLTKHLGSNFNAGAIKHYHGGYLRELGNINPRLEFAVYDAYFYDKNKSFHNVPASKKNLGLIYRMIFGKGYNRYANKDSMSYKGYMENSQLDNNNDGYITPEEAVQNTRFRKRNCPYWNDQDIINNSVGLTNEDLKLISWSPSLARAKSPQIGDLGGHFSFLQGLRTQLKMKEE